MTETASRDQLDRIGSAVDSGDLVTAAGVLLSGFPAGDLVGVALDQVPGQLRPDLAVPVGMGGLSEAAQLMRRGRHGWGQGEGPQGRIRCSAGTVQLVALDEGRAERVRAARRLPDALRFPLEVDVDAPWARQWVNLVTGELVGQDDEIVPSVRGRITEWSAKSRANMIRRMASTDWRPMVSHGVAPMVTLTYPGPWTAFAPTREVVGRHLEAFKEAYRREFCTAPMVGPLNRVKSPKTGRWSIERRRRIPVRVVMGAWKIEYQDRKACVFDGRHLGRAPHLHQLLPIPHGMTLSGFQMWVAWEWHRIIWDDRGGDFLRLLGIVGHDPDGAAAIYAEHSMRSLSAGTAVDLAEGVRCRDPRRIALYFLGHSLAHAADGGKEYQHQLPASYAGRAGRWWGIWGLPDTAEDRWVTADVWWALRDALGRYAEAEGRVAFQGGRMFGGWLAVPDGPELLLSVLDGLDVVPTVPERHAWADSRFVAFGPGG